MESESLNRKLERLETELSAYKAQSRLMQSFVDLARSPVKEGLLPTTLQNTLDMAADLTGADKSSLFLFDDQGRISESILTRIEDSPEKRKKLIGQVMDKGLAGWVMRHRRTGLVLDAEDDPRWLTLPDQPYLAGSALAVPVLRGDRLLGLLTLLHSKARHFTEETAELMGAVCDQIGLTLENARLYVHIETYSQALEEEMEKGRQIQRDFLPQDIPQPHGWEIAAWFDSAWQVSGDFYDVFDLPEGRLGVLIGDVSDKGVGAALFMAVLRSLIRSFAFAAAISGPEDGPAGPLKAVGLTNDYLNQNHAESGMFATLFFGVLDPITGVLTYINSGHESLLVIGPGRVEGRLKATGPAVGLVSEFDFQPAEITLEIGQLLLGFTDGVTEAKSIDEGLFTRGRLEKLTDRFFGSAVGAIETIKTELSKHTKKCASKR